MIKQKSGTLGTSHTFSVSVVIHTISCRTHTEDAPRGVDSDQAYVDAEVSIHPDAHISPSPGPINDLFSQPKAHVSPHPTVPKFIYPDPEDFP